MLLALCVYFFWFCELLLAQSRGIAPASSRYIVAHVSFGLGFAICRFVLVVAVALRSYFHGQSQSMMESNVRGVYCC